MSSVVLELGQDSCERDRDVERPHVHTFSGSKVTYECVLVDDIIHFPQHMCGMSGSGMLWDTEKVT